MDEIKADFQLEPVVSTNIAAIGFNSATSTMRVQFMNGLIYDAEGVTQADFDDFKSAKSKGVYFNKILKKAFAWKRFEKKS